MFSKILIANRGEIACRIIRTARRMAIATVAVYSDADRDALHVHDADEAIAIGPAPARDSYLRSDAIITAALRTGAQAIHPGYGFLSENADFAEACAAANIVFIGPPVAAIRAMGSKAAAKSIMANAGVALVPGYHAEAQDFAIFQQAAATIGYPVLIKASAGGGGKGMRVVPDDTALQDAIDGARREALASFGDGRLLIEKYLARPRHIEIQVFADNHGNCISLFERDCSIQRRHQKVLEESPAPFMQPEQRHAMGQAAIAAAQAVGYAGAGTVEFIAEDGHFYFMEMNTRLQVEHPVTEMVTGLDLVEWQLRVANNEPLPPAPAAPAGHAIEARIYAEDPSRDFLPSIGRLIHLRTPATTENVRIDTGVREGDDITPYYDPMIAKLIVHADDRPMAVRKLAAALSAFELAGVRSNLGLLRAIAAHPAYAAAEIDTGFIARHPDVLREPEATPAILRAVLAAAALDLRAAAPAPAQAADPYSPWDDADAWRMNGAPIQTLHVAFAGERITLHTTLRPNGASLAWNTETFEAERMPCDAPSAILASEIGTARHENATPGAIRVDGAVIRLHVVRHGSQRIVVHQGRNYPVDIIDLLAPPEADTASLGSLAAPIPARVTRIAVATGDAVEKGAVLLTLEAMKMELSITAPFAGIVGELRHAVGDMVEEGTILAVLTAQEPR